MRSGKGRGIFYLLLFILLGALIGGILGQLLSNVTFSGIMPYLTQTYEIFNFNDIYLNFAVLQIHFGVRFAPNMLSIIGIFIAWWIYYKF